MSFSEKQAKWAELCEAWRERQAALFAFNPFQNGLSNSDRLAEWNRLDEAMGIALGLMEEFIREIEPTSPAV